MRESQLMRIGPELPDGYVAPRGACPECGGQCDGDECGLHAAGCIYGGWPHGYWMIADGCPLDHGESVDGADG